MTYEAQETSVRGGRPFFLYLFDDGTTQTRLTSERDDVSHSTHTWTASPVSHSNIEINGDIKKSAIELVFPLSDEFARSLLVPITSRVVTVTIYRGHRNDADAELEVIWKGRMVGSESTQRVIKVSVESVFTSLRRPGCRVRYQRTCRHALYFSGCNLNYDDWKQNAYVTAITGLVLTIPAVDLVSVTGYYLAGIVEYNGAFGFIQNVDGENVTLVSPIYGLEEALDEASSGQVQVQIAPGCRLTRSWCHDVFDNVLNFGGFPYLPDDNPFEISLG